MRSTVEPLQVHRHRKGNAARKPPARPAPRTTILATRTCMNAPIKWMRRSGLLPQVRCYNERLAGSCRGVFRPWSERLNFSVQPLESDEDDPELLLHIPFNGAVKISSICVIGELLLPLSCHGLSRRSSRRLPVLSAGATDGSGPAAMRLFTNREDLDFGMVQSMQPVQEFELVDNPRGEIEYPTMASAPACARGPCRRRCRVEGP